MEEKRVIFHNGRAKFGGDPKNFTEISELASQFKMFKINSKERMHALEHFL